MFRIWICVSYFRLSFLIDQVRYKHPDHNTYPYLIHSYQQGQVFLYSFLPGNRVISQTLQRIFFSVAQGLCFSPVSGLLKCNILCFQFVILLGIRYTTETTKFTQEYLVNLATCILSAAGVTSHPHLGGDDNATTFGATETVRRESHIWLRRSGL